MDRGHKSSVANREAAAMRLVRPRVPDALLARPRLFRLLKAATRRRVTVVCAGAGWGKTALVASWTRMDGGTGPTAWLTAEDQHRQPHTFWSDLVMALGLSGAVPPGSRLAELTVAKTSEEDLPGRIGDALAGLPAPTVLVIDDVHRLTGHAVPDALTRLLHDLPGPLRVILVGRTEPPVDLHRLRVAGELAEIHADQLAFRAAEVSDLLALRGRRPATAEATRLITRTEGWPAALHLLADVLVERGLPALAEAPEKVREYVLREVLDDLPPPTRSFLLRTSVPETICDELAGALVGGEDAGNTLAALEHANLFLVRLDGSPGHQWFRYRGLFRDVLLRELELRNPDEPAELHVTAARWYAGQRCLARAFAHAGAARDWAFLGRLTVEYALPMALSGDRAALFETLRRIPPEHFADTAGLALCAATLSLLSDDYAGVRDQLARVGRMLGDGDPPDRTALDMAVDVMRIVVAPRLSGDMTTLVAEASQLLARLRTMRPDRLPALLEYRAVALGCKGAGLLWADRLERAGRYLWSAATAAQAAGVDLVEITAYAHLAVLVYLQGSLREAEQYVAAAAEAARHADLRLPADSAAAHFVQALIELERNRLPEAQEALRRGLHAAGERPEIPLVAVAMIVQANLLLVRDEPAAARELLRRCRVKVGREAAAPLVDRWLALAESEADLALGDPHGVIARYVRRGIGPVLLPAEQVMLARAHELTGDHVAAEGLLVRVREGPDTVAAVTAWVVTALIADAQGHARRSADALSQALRRAEGEHIRRPFRKFRSERLELLAERQRWLFDDSGPFTSTVLAGVEAEQDLPPLPAGPDPLSERERDVLHYLPTVLTANEIATDLGISVNTVKAHMRSIYRKLGAARRLEAVVQARRTGLL
jgi:LuxR family maltose regulon positive regulatory protein